MKNLIVLLIAVVLLSACKKELKLKKEYITPKLVGFCVFNQDSIWKLKLTKSASIYKKDTIKDINDAAVSILDENGSLIELLKNKGNGIYISEENKAKINTNYTVEIISKPLTPINAKSFIPNNFSITVDTSVLLRDSLKELEYSIKFFDNADEENFYIIEGATILKYGDAMEEVNSVYFSTKDIIVERTFEGVDPEYFAYKFYLKDEYFNGQKYDLKIKSSINYSFDDPEVKIEKVISQIKVSSVPKDYFLFLVSLEKYRNTTDDPFATPIKVYSNFEKGLGVFSGSNLQIIEFDITNEVLD